MHKTFLFTCSVLFGLGLVLWGCSEDSEARRESLFDIPWNKKVSTRTPLGHRVVLLRALKKHPQLVKKILEVVDTTSVTPDPRLPAVTGTGPPPGWRVVVLGSGAFPMKQSPTGFASGAADYSDRSIYVMLRVCSGKPLAAPVLPALSHELGHAWAWHLGFKKQANCFGHGNTCTITQQYAVQASEP